MLARNLARSEVGRAFAAVRDRDVAAGVMGVDLRRATSAIAFVVSSFYAGCAAALLFVGVGHFGPTQFGLLMSIQFIAMVLIGGVATISGSIMGALLIALLPRISSELPACCRSSPPRRPQHPNIFEVEQIIYGVLIVAVPAVRAARVVRHLDADQDLLEELPLLVLSRGGTEKQSEEDT